MSIFFGERVLECCNVILTGSDLVRTLCISVFESVDQSLFVSEHKYDVRLAKRAARFISPDKAEKSHDNQCKRAE